MTLQTLLQLDPRLLEPQFMPVLNAAEQLWQKRGRPTGRWELVDFLSAVIDECMQHDIEYPAVLLARKGQLKRGSFLPRYVSCDRKPSGDRTVLNATARACEQQEQTAKPGACPKCGGRGFVQLPIGTGTLCECAKKPAKL